MKKNELLRASLPARDKSKIDAVPSLAFLFRVLTNLFGQHMLPSASVARDPQFQYRLCERLINENQSYSSTDVTCIGTERKFDIDGWSAARGTLIFGMIWHFSEDSCTFKSILIPTLNTRTARESAKRMCCISQNVLTENSVIASNKISIHTIKGDIEAAIALSCGLCTNVLGLARCVVHTITQSSSDVFEKEKRSRCT